jgi:AraC family transcriptional regulator of adaptative response/methylated-DNA-[protein]-cysteine methyltransferase
MAATARGVCFVHFSANFADLFQALHSEFSHAELAPTPEKMSEDLDNWINALEQHIAGNGPRPDVPHFPIS